MLAASPSQSPTSFNYSSSSSNNESGALSQHNSYQSSPPFASSVSTRSPRPLAEKAQPYRQSIVASPTLRTSSYADASTQYSPMSELLRASPRVAPRKESAAADSQLVDDQPAKALTSANTLVQTVSNGSDPPTYTQSVSSVSPTAKRRQFKEIVESGSSTATATTSPISGVSKRPKATKSAAKILPVKYENCEVEDMVVLIADMISELIETNDNLPLQDVVLTRFHSRTPPGISVLDYLQRLAKHATLGPALLLSMVYYIDRLCSLYPAFSITTLTVHRFLITAATVAAKGLSDSFWNNSTYARVGGIKMAELGMLELEFLYRVDWRIVPNPEVLVDYYRGLVGRTTDYVLENEANIVQIPDGAVAKNEHLIE